MFSAKKVAANRRNARSSTGPRTKKGKAVSAQNAIKHGVLARSPVIKEVESQAEWEEHLTSIVSDLAPVGYLEHTLARRIALQTWRLERVRRYETAIAAARIDDIAPEEVGTVEDTVDAVFDGFLDATRDRDAFEAITKMKPFETIPLMLAVRIAERIASVNGLQLNEEAVRRAKSESGESQSEEARWPASELVELADAIGRQGGVPPGQALALSVGTSTHGWGRTQARLAELREQRLLPDARELELIARYEGTLERSVFKIMLHLERLQLHRLGGHVPAPVAVDVTVDAGSSAV